MSIKFKNLEELWKATESWMKTIVIDAKDLESNTFMNAKKNMEINGYTLASVSNAGLPIGKLRVTFIQNEVEKEKQEMNT